MVNKSLRGGPYRRMYATRKLCAKKEGRAMDLAKRYGVYQGDAAVFNDAFAWVLTNGVWFKHESFVILQEARAMTIKEFQAEFTSLPPLPKGAFGSVD